VAGVLMQREARYLDPAASARVRRKRDRISNWLTREIRTRRPTLTADRAELLAVCALFVLTSVSFHHVDLPRPGYDRLLGELAARVMLMDPPPSTVRETTPDRPKPATRAEEILDVATDLFAERGYNAVSIDDIGARVGVGGTALYNHFPGKQDVLNAAMMRGRHELRTAMKVARTEGVNPADVLRRLSDSYVDQTLDHPSVFGTLITESVHLDGPAGREARRSQLDYIADWVELARAHNPDVDPTTTRIKVQAVHMMAIDAARAPRLRRTPGLRATVREAAWLVQQ
jgi:AcrR family transcriptional regulator